MEMSHTNRHIHPTVGSCPARRSISIFSRRGVDTVETLTIPFPPAAMFASKIETPRKPNTWKRRFSRNKNADHQNDLLPVPPKLSISTITPLEQAMMTSPNDEILNAINKSLPPRHVPLPTPPLHKNAPVPTLPSHTPLPTPPLHISLPIPQQGQDWQISPTATSPFTRPFPSEETKLDWQNGTVFWDSTNHSRRSSKDFPNNSPPNSSAAIPSEKTVEPIKQRSAFVLPEIRPLSQVFLTMPGSVSQAGGKTLIHPAFRKSDNFFEEQPSHKPSSNHRRGHSAVESLASESLAKEPVVEEPLAEELLADESISIAPTKDEFFTMESLTASRSSSASFEALSDHDSSGSCSSSRTSVEVDQADSKRVGSVAYSINSPISPGTLHPHQTLDKGVPQLENIYESSPTLGKAMHALQMQLSSTSEGESGDDDDEEEGKEENPFSDMPQSQLHRAPTIPKKSRKREWKGSITSARPSSSKLTRSELLNRRKTMPVVNRGPQSLQLSIPACEVHRSHSSREPEAPECEMSLDSAQMSLLLSAITSLGPGGDESSQLPTISSPGEAQAVLFRIMSCLRSMADLRATAIINKGMYQVFKANELSLYQRVLWNQSPARGEMREWCTTDFNDLDDCISPKQFEHSQEPLTPSAFLEDLKKEDAVLRSLKDLVLQRCKAFIRAETVAALMFDNDVNHQRFEDAFYRIWCFCKIFGCGKGREDDVTGQLDWLRGGLLAHQNDCAATVNINLEFDMGGVLLNSPDYFATGNPNGLSAAQLYDMMELWNCITALLGGYQGQVHQARKYGIFENTGAQSGNLTEEEASLEEWMAYILTLGPSAVLDLARFSEDDCDEGFRVAKLNGWTDWELSSSGNSRLTFFREPVARLYEERMITFIDGNLPEQHEKKEMSRKRVASMAAEIKLSRSSSVFQRMPLIDLACERAMSLAAVTRRDSVSPRNNHYQHPAQPDLTPPYYGFWMRGKVAPKIEDKVENFNRLGLLSLEGVVENTSDKAIKKIVAMGFSATQAKDALKLTDMGDGLRVDRAVEVLLKKYGARNVRR